MSILAEAQVEQFEREGWLFLPEALPVTILDHLNEQFDAWVEESRLHDQPYGLTTDGRPRFDLEPGHSAERPALRRIASPTELSDAYLSVMRSCTAVDAAAELIGPNLEFSHSKVNSKQPGAATELLLEPTSLVHALHDDPLVTSLLQRPAPNYCLLLITEAGFSR